MSTKSLFYGLQIQIGSQRYTIPEVSPHLAASEPALDLDDGLVLLLSVLISFSEIHKHKNISLFAWLKMSHWSLLRMAACTIYSKENTLLS